VSVQKFANRALDGLSREYGIVGPISRTDGLDIAPPVLVHDVSENARAAAWMACSLPGTGLVLDTVAGSATVFAEVTRAAALDADPAGQILDLLRLQPSEAAIWPFGWSAMATAASAANVDGATIGVRMPQAPGGTGLVVTLMEYGNARPVSLTSGGIIELEPLDDIAYWGQQSRPFLLGDQGASGFLARLTSTAGGQAVVQFFVHCYLGPKGSIPPGV